MECSSDNRQVAFRTHLFHPAFHHPVIHVLQHTVSPLTGSLLIFGIHKAWQIPAAISSLRSFSALWRAGELASPLTSFRTRGQRSVLAIAAGALGYYGYSKVPTLPAPVSITALTSIYSPSDAPYVAQALSQWWTTYYITRALRSVHDEVGLPWWQTIAGVTLALRMALAPINLALLRNSLRMKIILPDVHRTGNALKSAHTPEARLHAARALRSLFINGRCSPWAHVIMFPLLLPPMILSVFGAVHNLCMAEPGMSTEGTLWFPDLIERDETQLLPILSALTWLWQVELGAGVHYAAWPTVRVVARISAVAMIPLSATLPSGVFVFWITSNLFAVARSYAARPDAVRRVLGIPLRKEISALAHLPPFRGS